MTKKPLPEAPRFDSRFAALGGLRGQLPPGAAPARSGPTAPPGSERAPARAVVRLERKGHGGKEVTRVEKLGLDAPDLAAWLEDAKRALGCGGTVDADSLVLQGDQRERLRGWLERRGVAKVST